MERQAAELEALAAGREAQLREFKVSNEQLAQAMQSRGCENLHMERRFAAVEAQNIIDAIHGSAKFLKSVASVQRGVDDRQAEIDRLGHEKLSSAKTSVEREAVVEEHFGWAESHSISAMGEIATMTARWESTHHAELLRIGSKFQAPRPDPVTPSHNPSPGIVKPLDTKTTRGKHAQGDEEEAGAEQSSTGGHAGDRDSSTKPKTAGDSRAGHTASEWPQGEPGSTTGGLPAPQAPSRATTPSPLSSGVPSSGGSTGGGGLGSGLGSSPLSSLGGGLGQSPTAGLSGLSSTNPASSAASSSGSAVNPGSAFARGFSSASSVVPPPVSSPSPAAGSPPVAGPASAPPVTGVAGSGPAAVAGAHGMVTPATAAGTAAGSGGSSMLLPSPGMGAPAAAGSTAAVAPVGSSSTSSAGASGASPAGAVTAAAGNVGPTLVPAAVVSAVDPERAVLGLSPDARAAALLAWRLWHDCREVGWPVNWAVGVFRSSEGVETVVHSTEGSGYVPANVHVPRGVRLLVADALVDSDFRKKWFGWADPIDVLAEYALMRQSQGWHLAAAAVVGVPGNPLALDRQVEFVACNINDSPHKPGDPVAELDQMHVHRLQLEYPDLYDRLERLSANTDHAVVEPLIRPLTQHLVDVALGLMIERFEDTEFRDALREQWRHVRTAAHDQPAPTPAELAAAWEPFTQLVITAFRSGVLQQPGQFGGMRPEDDQAGAREYRKAWKVARALEAVAGWAGWPQYRISLPGIVYAAAAAEPESDFREKISTSLYAAEAAMGW